MIIKHKDNKLDEIDYLSDLLERDISDDRKSLIDRELKNLYSGKMHEETSEYYLDAVFKNSKNWLLIHDLRIEFNGEAAKIDHLLIGRMMDIYVIESKNFTTGVSISDEGYFSYCYENTSASLSSPILQNEQDIKLLERFLDHTDLIPKRLGITLKPVYRNIILISPEAPLIKPKKGLYDCSTVMKADKFIERFKDDLDRDDIYDDMANIANVTSQDNLLRFCEKLVLHHKPVSIDYRTKFALQENRSTDEITTEIETGESPDCPVCGKSMILREAKKGKNEGKKFWGCQQFPKCRGIIERGIFELEEAQSLPDEQEAVSENSNNQGQPLCPKCHGQMVKRVSKKGKNTGREFWGCMDFPNCRGVVSINQNSTGN